MISEQRLNSTASESNKGKLLGRVASILNANELVINIGVDKGVVRGMKFAVMAESPVSILDPETGEVLDTIDREKVRVEAVEVRQKVSICRTFRKREIPAGSLYGGPLARELLGGGLLAGAFDPPQVIEENLKVQDVSLPPPLSSEESYVKINDRVIQVS